MTPPTPTPIADRTLVLERVLKAPRHLVWRCWTDPRLLAEWFCPKPWYIDNVELDVRPGGGNAFVMHGPDGETIPNRGVYLEVIENEKLVLTDAYVKAWEPSENPFMTAIVTLEETPEGYTKYVATALHWSLDTKKQHEQMGFHEGWGICADQLEALAQSLNN
ncbi:SRPBCC family protein [Asticcacaulis sp. AND118]|uniref:SRPBCC family protein n=1 Tax=Asticcacaulis sp. AND118 TaxID=2840468 RepID=UPI001CFFF48C|nr:SRPBCC family protein [Asticcacaulis sp. AND118]UDF03667.1 SRPBCC family protein [Asticcacaulis sp. AND118]